MRTLLAFLLVAVALAGCTDNNASSGEPTCPPETHFRDAEGACVPHVEPRMSIEGLPAAIEQYQAVSFTWALDNGTRGAPGAPVHSMDSRILLGNATEPVTNTTGPDDWGTQIAREEHQNLPGQFEASFSWEAPETLAVRGYMRIDGEHLWYDLGTLIVEPVSATGNTTTISISGTPPSLSESNVGIRIGDGVSWDNENTLYGYTIEFSCNNGVTVDPVEVPAGGSSAAVVFLELTNCDYTATTTGSGSGLTQGDLSGKLNVNKP